MTSTVPVFPWLPSAGRTASRPAGVHWDVIVVPAHLSEPVLEALADQRGAVICDPRGGVHYWLVRPGAADGWDLPPTDPRGTAQYVTIPAADRQDGPLVHWLSPPVPGRSLTDETLLRGALLAAIEAQPDPTAGWVHEGVDSR